MSPHSGCDVCNLFLLSSSIKYGFVWKLTDYPSNLQKFIGSGKNLPSHGWFMTLFSPHGRILRFLSRPSSTGPSFQVLKTGEPWEAAKIHGETTGIPSRLNMTHGFTMNLRNIPAAFQITSDEDPI